jgi:hypothetical protein
MLLTSAVNSDEMSASHFSPFILQTELRNFSTRKWIVPKKNLDVVSKRETPAQN